MLESYDSISSILIKLQILSFDSRMKKKFQQKLSIKMNKHLFKFIFCSSFFALMFFFLPLTSRAAVLYLDPGTGTRGSGDIFTVKIKIDPEGDCINAAESALDFTPNLEFVDFSTANSIFSLWIQRPGKESSGEINGKNKLDFSGGIPGGFCGATEGDIGETNIIAEAVFMVRENAEGLGNLTFNQNTKVLLNDGKGSEAVLKLSGASFSLERGKATSTNDWTPRIEEDKVMPEQFILEIQNTPSVFNGKYFAVFSTTDKQSGIDHYEISEEKIKNNKSFWDRLLSRLAFKNNNFPWQRAEAPYLLKDQSLESVITVRAIDKAGNERVVKWEKGNRAEKTLLDRFPLLGLVLAGLIILSLVMLSVTRKRNNEKKKIKEDEII
jgi:hypothetical protein